VDEFTVDFVCNEPCPVLPRFGQYHLFVAPGYHQETPQEERDASGQVIGWGPYEWVEWNRAQDIRLTAYEGYVEPQPVNFMTQAPTIKDVTYIWRAEEVVRSAMVQTGEADLAWAMAIDQADAINNSENGKTVKVVSGEVYTLNVDTIWHPELSKLKVRQALAHAINCEELALALFGPESRCSSGPNGIPGTLGGHRGECPAHLTYDPAKARQLLEEANYDPSNVIDYWTREGRYAKDVELSESLITFWDEVGLNVELNVVENTVWNDHHLTGPAVAYDAALKNGATPAEAAQAVHDSSPPAPCNCSPGLINFAPGGEYFDFGRQINST
jgi:peptide/nickel transport system substrate-binding protein